MGIRGLDHINIDTCQPDATVDFYTEVLGLENRPDRRPDFDFPGAWLFSGERAVVHLNFIDADDRFGQRSAFNHIAFEGSDFDTTCRELEAQGIEHRTAVRDEMGLRQIFVNDPNGIRVEINIRA